MNQDNNKNQFKRFALQYLVVYFNNRNFNELLKMLDKDVTGFGTGIDEKAYEKNQFFDLFARDITSVPDPIHYDIEQQGTTILSENTGLFYCELNIHGKIDGCDFSLNHLRQTLVMKKIEDRISIVHIHVSFPTLEHDEGESYPLKEIADITKVANERVKKETVTLLEAYKELEHAVIYDNLTKLFNRNRLDDLLNQEIERSNRYGSVFCLLWIDIDNFKNINDNYGHQTGDLIIQELASIIRESLRSTDYPGRWGGDEFLLILPESNIENAKIIASNLLQKIKNRTFSNCIKTTISIGLCDYQTNDTAKSMFSKADKALYMAKEKGKNTIVVI